MDIDLLKTFLTLARLKSFTLAAKEMQITQPALSKRIKRLEEIIGSSLFDRLGHNISLTEAGKLLAEKAPTLVNSINLSLQEIRDLSGKVAGQLPIATSHYIGLHHLPLYLESFITDFSEVDLDINFIDSGMAYEQVLTGDIELALVTFPQTKDARLKHIPVWQERMQVACHRNHPLAKTKSPLTIINQYDCIFPPAHTFPRELFEFNLKELGIEHGKVKTANYLEVIAKLVGCKMGWTLLPETMIKPPLISLTKARNLSYREMGIIHRKNKTLSNAATAFITLLQN